MDSSKKIKILMVEDDQVLAPLVIQFLQDQQFEVSWEKDGIAGAIAFSRESPDLVILDLMLPGRDGLSLCQEIRSKSNTAIIMLTAKGDEADRVTGLDLGADDYLAKPFGLKELLARIKAVLRRTNKLTLAHQSSEITFGSFKLDLEKRQLYKVAETIELTRSEFDILKLLAESPNRVFTRDNLLDCIKGGDTESFDRAVDMHISNLRKKIEDNQKSPQYLKTVWGIGYRFVL